MPVMLLPRQLTVVDGRRLESRERSENKTKWISLNLRKGGEGHGGCKVAMRWRDKEGMKGELKQEVSVG